MVSWLEESAGFEQSDLGSAIDVKNFESANACWENTLDMLARERKGISTRAGRRDGSSTANTVTVMDPDAVTRTGHRLHSLDERDDARILKKLYTLVRTGRLEEVKRQKPRKKMKNRVGKKPIFFPCPLVFCMQAQTLCRHCGMPWRAASLEGWRLFHDANFDRVDAESAAMADEDEGLVADVEGNWTRDIWKATCLAMSSDEDLDQYERAIYGILRCGRFTTRGNKRIK